MQIIENPSHMLLAEQSEPSISVTETDALDFIGNVFKSFVGTTVPAGSCALPSLRAEPCLSETASCRGCFSC